MDLMNMLGGSKDDAKKATDLLKQDHKTVKGLFRSYKEAKENGDGRAKKRLFLNIDRELSIHALVEEEIFYPAVRKQDKEQKDMVLEAREEHGIVKTLLSQLRELGPGDETFDAKMKVLMEGVEHHADEEEDEMFPEAEKLGDDRLRRLGAEITARKEQLTRETPAGLAATAAGSSAKRSSRGARRAPATPSKRGGAKRASARGGSARGRATKAKAAKSSKTAKRASAARR